MTYHIVVQRIATGLFIPDTKKLKNWITAALKTKLSSADVTLRIVDPAEIAELNRIYRKKDKPTNVLSFPFDTHLGDIVICAGVVNQEALEQNKQEIAHWAHMVIHGTLHLLGYDHVDNQEAEIMEKKEITILNSLGFSDPYHIEQR